MRPWPEILEIVAIYLVIAFPLIFIIGIYAFYYIKNLLKIK